MLDDDGTRAELVAMRRETADAPDAYGRGQRSGCELEAVLLALL